MRSVPSKGSMAGGQVERLSLNIYILLFPLFVIASHPPPPPGDGEMGESFGGCSVKNHEELCIGGGSANFLASVSTALGLERRQCNERWRHRQTGGGGMTRGDTTNSQGRGEASAPEKKKGTTRGGSPTRSGQVEAPPDGRRWRKRKWGGGGEEATQQPSGADKLHESEDWDLAELEATMDKM